MTILVNSMDRERMAAILEDRNRPQKRVQRAKVILLSAEQLTTLEIAARSGANRPSVRRWQQRFAEEGMDGLLRNKTRKPGKTPLSPSTIARVLADRGRTRRPGGKIIHAIADNYAHSQTSQSPPVAGPSSPVGVGV